MTKRVKIIATLNQKQLGLSCFFDIKNMVFI